MGLAQEGRDAEKEWPVISIIGCPLSVLQEPCAALACVDSLYD